jgi:YVTN family beta-propeller protein
MSIVRLIAGLALSALSVAAQAQTTPSYHVSKTVPLAAPDRWDYVVYDPDSHRVYVAHGDGVSVVDGITGAIIGNVKGFPGGTHGTAVVTNIGRGFTDDGRAGEVGSFSLKDLKVDTRIKTAEDPDAIVFDAGSGHVFVVDGDSGKLTVIDPKLDVVVATIAVGGALESAAPGPDGKLYVNGAERKEVVRIDTHKNQVDARWPIPQCTSPHGLAFDSATRRLFISCVNNILAVIDAETGATVANVPIGSETDAAAFDPKRNLIFSSNGRDGTLSMIRELDANHFVAVGTIKTAITARTMAIDPVSGRLYIAAADVDATAAAHGAPPAPGARRPLPIVPGSLKLLFLDPVP